MALNVDAIGKIRIHNAHGMQRTSFDRHLGQFIIISPKYQLLARRVQEQLALIFSYR